MAHVLFNYHCQQNISPREGVIPEHIFVNWISFSFVWAIISAVTKYENLEISSEWRKIRIFFYYHAQAPGQWRAT